MFRLRVSSLTSRSVPLPGRGSGDHRLMPHQILGFPFRISNTGAVATIPQGGVEEGAQMVRVIVSTILGERPMAERFGIPDPAFVGVEVADIATVIRDYDLTLVEVEDVEVLHPSEGLQQAQVRWRLSDPETVEGDEEESA